MKHNSPLGSRIAEVHNGSSLFTGDAGSGESNVRRWVVENDWLEAIIALPMNMFYNTGIATYVWVLSNRKPGHRRGKVQLIDATQWFRPLRKNQGKKNCELADTDIDNILEAFLAFEPSDQSRIFDNAEFGYWKVTVERPLRLRSEFTRSKVEALKFLSGQELLRQKIYDEFGDTLFENFLGLRSRVESFLIGNDDDAEDEEAVVKPKLSEKQRKNLLKAETWERDGRLFAAGESLLSRLGSRRFMNFDEFQLTVAHELADQNIKLSASEQKLLCKAVSARDEQAEPSIRRVHKHGKIEVDPLRGLFPLTIDGKRCVVEYEPDSDLRDTETVPLKEPGGIEAFIRREVLPHAPDVWIDETKTTIGYEISFTRYFYKPQPLRPLEAIRADIVKLEQESNGILATILLNNGGSA
jgi:type I restriction enzyme M protein